MGEGEPGPLRGGGRAECPAPSFPGCHGRSPGVCYRPPPRLPPPIAPIALSNEDLLGQGVTSGGRAGGGPGGREWPPPANLLPPLRITPCHPPPTNPPSPGDRSLPRPAADASPVSFSLHARAQTEADITFTFDVKDSGYTSFFYNTTSAPGARFSVVSAVMRNATDELFVRLHLGGAIDPAGTTAEVVEQGGQRGG